VREAAVSVLDEVERGLRQTEAKKSQFSSAELLEGRGALGHRLKLPAEGDDRRERDDHHAATLYSGDLRSAIVAEARTWIGTPFRWGQATKGRGVDCKGLLWGVARELGRPEAQSEFAQFVGYRDKTDVRHLLKGIGALFNRVKEMRPGDILVLIVGWQPQHIAIYAGGGKIIHTARGIGQVREVPLGKSRRVHSIWTWRGLNEH
jgi:cell wall-associated NlpC family hydrolase